MVWQRGGELLESPGWNLECADTGGGKTTEVKRCLVSSYQMLWQNRQKLQASI